MAVIAPTGSSEGEIIVLAIVSAIVKYIAPIKKDDGIIILLSTPQISLHTWGTTSPTNPIIPLTETTAPISKLAAKYVVFFKTLELTPRDFAVSLPKAIILYLWELMTKKIKTEIVIAETSHKFSNLANERLPTIQKTAVLKESFKKITINNIAAEKKAPIITPDKSRVFGSKSPYLLPRKKTRSITKKAPEKAIIWVPKKVAPIIKDNTAPKVPPLEIPNIYGSANGFIRIAWKTAPATDKPPPIKIAKSTLGNLICNTIWEIWALASSLNNTL